MTGLVRVLILEDAESDAELMAAELERAGLAVEWQRVEDWDGFAAAARAAPDLILADFSQPHFDALRALEELKGLGLEDIPFIVVSGAVSEETAVECMRRGAADYVMKDRMARLGQAAVTVLATARLAREERAAQEALRRSEALLKAMVERVPAIVYSLEADRAGRCLYLSPQLERLTGYLPGEWIDDPGRWIAAVHPLDRSAVRFAREAAATSEGSLRVEYRLVGRDGRVRWMRDEATLVAGEAAGPSVLRGVMQDITDLKEAELATRLRASQQRAVAQIGQLALEGGTLDETLDAACRAVGETLGVELVDVLEINDTYDEFGVRAVFGWDQARVGSRTVPVAHSQAGHALLTQQPVIVQDLATESRFNSPGLLSEQQVVSGLSVAIPGGDAPFGVLGAHSRAPREFTTDDVSFLESVANVIGATAARLASQSDVRRLAAIVEASGDSIITTDSGGTITSWNPAAEALTGWPAADAIGEHVTMLVADEDAEWYERILAASLRGEHVDDEETEMVRRDGSRRPISLSLSPIFGPDGVLTAIASIARDLTERRRLEDERLDLEARLSQAGKLETVGQLAGGIAHDFNNLLAVIINYAEFVVARSGDERVREDVREIRKAADRAAALTRKLLAFSRREVVRPRVLDLAAAIEETTAFLARTLGEHVELTVDCDPRLGKIEADPTQIEQVLINLAVNARDAMGDGGRLTISAHNEVDQKAREQVVLTVADSGCGMDEATRARAFDPFFTTKARGTGTGLGLASVYGIVQQAGAEIEIASEPGAGTTVTIRFPRVHRPGAPSAPLPHVTWASQLRVLLVEDEDAVRTIAVRLLVAAGHDVTATASADEAVAACEAGPPFDVVLTDVVMPDVQGPEVVRRIAGICPDARVVYMSGYTDDAAALVGIRDSEATFLEKPFDRERLLTALASAMAVA